jgi:hypothetical protein
MTSNDNDVDDVKLRIFTDNGKTHTKIALSRRAGLVVSNDSDDKLSVRIDTKDALMLDSKPVDEFEVDHGDLVRLTVNPKYPVGHAFSYTATIAGCEEEDPVIIIEH